MIDIQERGASRIRPDTAALREVLTTLGEPQRSFPSILVAGTNGKGSTAAMLASILRAHGLAVGRYTSPHLVRVEERIWLNGRCISSSELQRHLARLDPFPHLTYFETLTAVALGAFAECGMDCAVLEAGIGGRWDATRLAGSTIAGLTNVGSDHQRWLGTTRQEVAADKGQALAAARFAVIGPGADDELVPYLQAPQAVAAADLVSLQPVAVPASDSRGSHSQRRHLARWQEAGVELQVPLAGAHQLQNLHLALALASVAQCSGLLAELRPDAVQDGLRQVHWPGRLSLHRIGTRRVLLDAAHNLEAAQALAAHLATGCQRFHLLFSALDDKPVAAMAAVLRPHVDRVAVCRLDDERAMPVPYLAEAFPGALVADEPLAALGLLPDPVVAAGSLRLAGALLASMTDGENTP